MKSRNVQTSEIKVAVVCEKWLTFSVYLGADPLKVCIFLSSLPHAATWVASQHFVLRGPVGHCEVPSHNWEWVLPLHHGQCIALSCHHTPYIINQQIVTVHCDVVYHLTRTVSSLAPSLHPPTNLFVSPSVNICNWLLRTSCQTYSKVNIRIRAEICNWLLWKSCQTF